MKTRTISGGLGGALLLLFSVSVLAQGTAVIPGVYTCVDAKGRKLTSDRPIPDCLDREQQVIGPSGTVKAKVGPSLTAQEKAAQDAKDKRDAEDRNRLAEEKRRERALLIRYPNKAVHDKERKEAVDGINAVLRAATGRLTELQTQRKALDDEMEFYKKDPSKAPAYLRRQVEENTQSQSIQTRFITEQESEIQRVNARFDEELVRLKQLWSQADQGSGK